MQNDPNADQDAGPIAIELPYFVATLLPDGNLDVRVEGSIPVDKMFTIAALAARIANKTLDDEADAETRRNSLILRHGGKGKRN